MHPGFLLITFLIWVWGLVEEVYEKLPCDMTSDFSSHSPLMRQSIKKHHCSVSLPIMNSMKTRVIIYIIRGMSLNTMDE